MPRPLDPNSISGRIRACPADWGPRRVATEVGCTENLVRVVRHKQRRRMAELIPPDRPRRTPGRPYRVSSSAAVRDPTGVKAMHRSTSTFWTTRPPKPQSESEGAA